MKSGALRGLGTKSVLAASVGFAALSGCSSSSSNSTETDPTCTAAAHCTFLGKGTTEDHVQDVFARAAEGDTIKFGAGTFLFQNQLTLAANGVSVLGAGPDLTTLDFAKQVAGSEGIFAQNVQRLRLEGFAVKDTKGNAIKVLGSTGVTFRKLKVTWTGSDPTAHGAYGLYPVQSKMVLVEGCVVTGASDAGLYIGQSENVIIRDNEAFENVAGIEIENTFSADVYRNKAHDNTGGILVFDLPDLQQLGGHAVRVHDNDVRENNTNNFAPKGNIVGQVPAGTGFLAMANTDVEVFANTFTGNKTAQVAIVSYLVVEIPIKDANYYPYPSKVNVHNNTFEGGGKAPDATNRLGLLLLTGVSKFPGGVVPEVVYDGIVDEKKGTGPNAMQICVRQPGTHFGNLHLDKLDTANPDLPAITEMDPAGYDCELPPVAEVVLTGLDAK
jgi:parallel beta-helix repeat protein